MEELLFSSEPCTLSVQRLHQIRSRTFCYIIILTLKHPHNVCPRFSLSNRNKLCPTKVEVNEATVDDVVKYGHLITRSEAEMAEAIDIYKALGNDVYYESEEQPAEPQQQQEQ